MKPAILQIITNEKKEKNALIIEIKKSEEEKNILALIKSDMLPDWDELKKSFFIDPLLLRRESPRFRYHTSCKIEIPGSPGAPAIDTETEDISVDGMSIKNLSFHLKENTHIKCSFHTPNTTTDIETEAAIVNITKDRIGLRFHTTKEKQETISRNLAIYIFNHNGSVQEKRRTGYRFPVQTDCRVSISHTPAIKGTVKDISCTGISVIGIPQEFREGTETTITIPLSDGEVNFTGQVVRNSNNETGIQLYDELELPIKKIFHFRHMMYMQILKKLLNNVKEKLPLHMIPGYYMSVDSFPLHDSGQVDGKALETLLRNFTEKTAIPIHFTRDEKVINDIWIKTLNENDRNYFHYNQLIDKLPEDLINRYPILRLLHYCRNNESSAVRQIKEEKKYYPLTHPQKRIWYSEKLFQNSGMNNLVFTFIIPGKVNFNKLKEAINHFINECDTVRIRITEYNSKPKQYVSDFHPLSIDFFNFNRLAGKTDFDHWIETKATSSMYHEDNNLFYFACIIFPGGQEGFCMAMHHIISDGVSINIAATRIFEIYQLLNLNQEYRYEKTPQYLDYITYEKNYLQSSKSLESKEFWLNKLTTYSEQARIKGYVFQTIIKSKRNVFELPAELSQNIKLFCINNNVSVFHLFLAALFIYVYRISNKNDAVIGTMLANRMYKPLKKAVGMFVSTTPIRMTLKKEQNNFIDYLKAVKQEVFSVFHYQEYPFDLLSQELKVINKNLENFIEIIVSLRDAETPISQKWHFHGAEYFPLFIEITDKGEKNPFSLIFDYQVHLYNDEEIMNMYKHLMVLIQNGIRNPISNIFELDLLTAEEKHKIVNEFNNTFIDYPGDKTIHQLFEEQVERTPLLTAVVCNGKSLTYRELNEKANQLAKTLRNRGVKPDSIVALLLYRSFEMIIGILGILKAGGAYLPIDPDNPPDRKKYLLEDSQVSLLLTTKDQSLSYDWKGETILLDDYRNYHGDCTNLKEITTSQNLAYIIYTSGSTGNPKGVMIEHRSAVNILTALERKYPILNTDTYLLKTNYTFDVSVAELFGWFIGNGKLVILDPGLEKEPRKMIDIIHREKITHINFVPSMFKLFLFCLEEDDREYLQSLKYIFIAGEAITSDIINDFYALKTNIKLENIYGPTESTIYATGYSLEHLNYKKDVPIGKPLPNIKCYILNEHNQIMPIGVAGELCLGGIGLARGYLNRKELTSEKFTEDPFNPGQKIYRTGDLCRWLSDGNIEYLGRIDFQVKIRGYRVELGEIENTIRNYNGIKDAVITVKKIDLNDVRLAAYIVENNGSKVDISLLKKSLKKKLPAYMIPSFYAKLDHIPLNQNGKIDRKELDTIKLTTIQEEGFIAPISVKEKQIAGIWREILKIEQIGVNDNFFEIGGNSLKLIELQVKLNKSFNKEIPVIELFKYPTIKAQFEYIIKNEEEKNDHVLSHNETKRELGNRDIAVIGMSGRFPGAADIDAYWDNLIKGKETISFFTDEELLDAGVLPELVKNPNYVNAKGILENADSFDPDFFGYTKREAMLMDPQVRVFHEVVYEALENAGYANDHFEGKIGIFAGASNNIYWQQNLLIGKNDFTEQFPAIILNKDYLCTRVAYKLNLRGPAYNVQTACSTSLVAVDMAVHSLLENDCDMAVAGGVSIFSPQKQGYLYKEGFTLSPDGHCRAFDAEANGMVIGEGAGVVVLKKYTEAVKDKDYIWAIIRGNATNNDGCAKIGYTAPSITGQADVIKKSIERAGIKPETITYIETHGTGTTLGDPVEIEGLKSAFNTPMKQFCRIGSVKTNIGHLDAAAGIAGLIKTVLMLHYKTIPPSLNYCTPNPKIDFEDSPFIVNNKLMKWDRINQIPLRAGVSSFGIGGTNAHVILEEASLASEEIDKGIQKEDNYDLITLSAKTEKALNALTLKLYKYLKETPNIDFNSLVYTLQMGRKAFEYRRIIVCRTVDEAIDILEKGESQENIFTKKTDNELNDFTYKKKKAGEILESFKDNETRGASQLLELGKTWCDGVDIDWQEFHTAKIKRIPLPAYPFDRENYSMKVNADHSDAPYQEKKERIAINDQRFSPEEITDTLSAIWEKFFGISGIGLNENFFTLGGDSLLALQMISEINKRFILNLSANILMNLQTINDLSDSIREMMLSAPSLGKTNGIISRSLMLLKNGQGRNSPVFLIHPVAGTVYFYHDLCQFLSKDQTVYGIEAQGVDGQQIPLTAIEVMAAKYIKLIRRVQPHGPYYIGGSSMGGCIAYEMAVQLHDQKESVGALIMLDTPGPKTIIPDFKSDSEVLAYFLSYDNFNFHDTAALLKTMSPQERLSFFIRQKSVYQQTLSDEISIKNLENSIRLTLIHLKAMKKYYSKPLPSFHGKILFFAANEPSIIPIGLENDWKDLFNGNYIVHKVNGNHVTINVSPNVKIVAQYINENLKLLDCKLL